MSAVRYWVWLTSLRGVRSTALRLVLDHFGGPMEAYYAPRGAYQAVNGLLDRERRALENRDLTETERILDVCLRKGIHIIARQDAGYPQRLAQIYDAPPVLYVRGRLPFVDELPTVALVGTRSASAYGVKMGMQLGPGGGSGGRLRGDGAGSGDRWRRGQGSAAGVRRLHRRSGQRH